MSNHWQAFKDARRAGTRTGAKLLTILIGGVFLGSLWTYSWASGGLINACAEEDGDIYLIGSAFKRQECKKRDSPMSWNIQGPQGPPGEAGVKLLGSLSDTFIALQSLTNSNWQTVPDTAICGMKQSDTSILRVTYQISSATSVGGTCEFDISIDGDQHSRPHLFGSLQAAHNTWLANGIASGNRCVKLMARTTLGACVIGGDQNTEGLVEEIGS